MRSHAFHVLCSSLVYNAGIDPLYPDKTMWGPRAILHLRYIIDFSQKVAMKRALSNIGLKEIGRDAGSLAGRRGQKFFEGRLTTKYIL